jgi:hypothetical protein
MHASIYQCMHARMSIYVYICMNGCMHERLKDYDASIRLSAYTRRYASIRLSVYTRRHVYGICILICKSMHDCVCLGVETMKLMKVGEMRTWR